MRMRVCGILGGLLMVGMATAPEVKAQAKPASVADERALADTQEQLIKLLRVSPTLTEVVSRDPSLLSEAAYVTRENPELEQFLVAHPEVARNPDFYLFSGLRGEHGQRREALERRVWSGGQPDRQEDPNVRMILQDVSPLLAFGGFLAATIWFVQFFVGNRRWQRTYKMQMDAQERLIDKFSSNEQLTLYMETTGKRLLEMPVMSDPAGGAKIPNIVSRVLISLQVGVVMALLGIGFLFVHHVAGVRSAAAMGSLVVAILLLMPGIGFILSAGISWKLAERLKLLPVASTDPTNGYNG